MSFKIPDDDGGGLIANDAPVAHLKGCADRVICDPPFLSEECQTKGTQSLSFWL